MRRGMTMALALLTTSYMMVLWTNLETAIASTAPVMVDQVQLSSSRHEIRVEAPMDLKIKATSSMDLQRLESKEKLEEDDLQPEASVLVGDRRQLVLGWPRSRALAKQRQEAHLRRQVRRSLVGPQMSQGQNRRMSTARKELNPEFQTSFRASSRPLGNQIEEPNKFQTSFKAKRRQRLGNKRQRMKMRRLAQKLKEKRRLRRLRQRDRDILTPADNITLNDLPDNGKGSRTNGYHKIINGIHQVLENFGGQDQAQVQAPQVTERLFLEDATPTVTPAHYDHNPWRPFKPSYDYANFKKVPSTQQQPSPSTNRHSLQSSPTSYNEAGFFDEYLIEFDDEEGKQARLRQGIKQYGRPITSSPKPRAYNNYDNYDTNDDYVDYDDPDFHGGKHSGFVEYTDEFEKHGQPQVNQQHEQQPQQVQVHGRPPYPPSYYGHRLGQSRPPRPTQNSNHNNVNLYYPRGQKNNQGDVFKAPYDEPDYDNGEGIQQYEGDYEDYGQGQGDAQDGHQGYVEAEHFNYRGQGQGQGQGQHHQRPPQHPRYHQHHQQPQQPQHEEPQQYQQEEPQYQQGYPEEYDTDPGAAPYIEETNDEILRQPKPNQFKEVGDHYYPNKFNKNLGQYEDVPVDPQFEAETEDDYADIAPNSEYVELYGGKPTPLYDHGDVEAAKKRPYRPGQQDYDYEGEHQEAIEGHDDADDDVEHHQRGHHRQRRPQYQQRRPQQRPDYDDYGGHVEDAYSPDNDNVAYTDDGNWDNDFEGLRQLVDKDINNLAVTAENYAPPEGSEDEGQQQGQGQAGEGEEGDYQDQEGESDEDYEAEEQSPPSRPTRPRARVGQRPKRIRSRPPMKDRSSPYPFPQDDYETFKDIELTEDQTEHGFHDDRRPGGGIRAPIRSRPYRGRDTSRFGPGVDQEQQQPQKQEPQDFKGNFESADIPGFDDFFKKIHDQIDKEITNQHPYFDGDSQAPWAMPTFDGEDKDKPADGLVDNSADLKPNNYDHALPPDEFSWQMPSHEELQENYKTHVTADSNQDPVTAVWAPKKVTTTAEGNGEGSTDNPKK